jgi:two-component system chemotaxis sensor kinase CheA
VIKSLEANYRKVAGVSGATIMGDGHVALILDVAVLAAMARNAMPAAA